MSTGLDITASALQLIQSISLAEERTADPRDLGPPAFAGESPSLGSLELSGLRGWAEQFDNLSLRQMPGLPGADSLLSASQTPVPRLEDDSDPYARPGMMQSLGKQLSPPQSIDVHCLPLRTSGWQCRADAFVGEGKSICCVAMTTHDYELCMSACLWFQLAFLILTLTVHSDCCRLREPYLAYTCIKTCWHAGTGGLDNSLREEGLIQSMQHGQGKQRPQHAQNWLFNYPSAPLVGQQGLHQPGSNMPGESKFQ